MKYLLGRVEVNAWYLRYPIMENTEIIHFCDSHAWISVRVWPLPIIKWLHVKSDLVGTPINITLTTRQNQVCLKLWISGEYWVSSALTNFCDGDAWVLICACSATRYQILVGNQIIPFLFDFLEDLSNFSLRPLYFTSETECLMMENQKGYELDLLFGTWGTPEEKC